MRIKALAVFILFIVVMFAWGCSGSGDITAPDVRGPVHVAETPHQLWGLWSVSLNEATNTLDFAQLRSPEMHLNVLPFLESKTKTFMTLESPVVWESPTRIRVDIGLQHPFLGAKEFAGFDVRGIVISKSSLTTSILPADYPLHPINTDLRLNNADGYTRWWNPKEFPYDAPTEIFTYKDGLLGAPNSFAAFNAIINGYKFFADGLGPTDNVATVLDHSKRALFTPGNKVIRRYIIDMGPAGLLFNYAVDASWELPLVPPADIVLPDSFELTANCPEAYHIEILNSHGALYPFGGSVFMDVEVFDHQPGTIQKVTVVSRDIMTADSTATFQYSTAYSEIYELEFHNWYTLKPAGEYDGLITVYDTTGPGIGSYPGKYPLSNYTAYKIIPLTVEPAPAVWVTLEEDATFKTIGNTFFYDTKSFSSPPPDVNYLDTDGPWDFTTLTLDDPQATFQSYSPAGVPFDPSAYPFELDHFWMGTYDFGTGPIFIFEGEKHDSTADPDVLKVYGIYETSFLNGNLLFNEPLTFSFPYDKSTFIDTSATAPSPFGDVMVNWHIEGLGEGTITTANYPTGKAALLVRNDIQIYFTWVSTTVPALEGVMYQWYMDDGTEEAFIMAGNLYSGFPNFDTITKQITGGCTYMVRG